MTGENVFCHVTALLDGDGSVRDGWAPREQKHRAESYHTSYSEAQPLGSSPPLLERSMHIRWDGRDGPDATGRDEGTGRGERTRRYNTRRERRESLCFEDELNQQTFLKPAPGDEVIYDAGNSEQLQWLWVASSRMNVTRQMRRMRDFR